MITTIDVLTPEQCARAVESVHAFSDHWLPRGSEQLRFYTLGAASYIDASRDRALYDRHATENNPLLAEHFGWLHALVREALSAHLGQACVQAPGLALPGFHVWRAPMIITTPTASVHFDLQHQLVGLSSRERPLLHKTISFTLAVKVPKAGAGMDLWDVTYDDMSATFERTRVWPATEPFCHPDLVVHHPYQLGVLALHDGTRLHRIAPTPELAPDDERITLQGHGVLRDGTWQLYW